MPIPNHLPLPPPPPSKVKWSAHNGEGVAKKLGLPKVASYGPGQTGMQVNTNLEMRTCVDRLAMGGQTDRRKLNASCKKTISVQPQLPSCRCLRKQY